MGIWDDVSKELAKDGTVGLVQYLKKGDTTIKLCVPAGAEVTEVFARFNDFDMNGVACPGYLISGLIIRADDEDLVDKVNVKYIKVKKSVMDAIVGFLKQEDSWEFVSDNGELLTITKMTKKPWYSVSPMKRTFDSSLAVFPETDIQTAAKEEEARVLERLEEKGGAAKPKAKKVNDDQDPF